MWIELNLYHHDGIQPNMSVGIINEHECKKDKKLTLFWILNGCGSGLGLGFWILALAGIAQMICSFVVVRVVVAVAAVAVVAAAVVVDNTNHVEKDFGSTDFPVEMQHFVDLGCYTKFVGGFVVASEDSVVASE